MENSNVARVRFKSLKDPFNCPLFKCYKFMKGRTGSSCHVQNMSAASELSQAVNRLVLRLKFMVTVELLYDQAESDFVQCQTKMRAFTYRICSRSAVNSNELNFIEIELFIKML